MAAVEDPTIEEVIEKPKKEPKAKKPLKPLKPKPKKCNVPKRMNSTNAFAWMYHVHTMMVESGIPLTDEIIDAYNAMVAYLEQFNMLVTRCPYKFEKYTSGITIVNRGTHIYGLSMTYHHTVKSSERERICKEIVEHYQPLYDLIAPVVIPFMKQKSDTILIVNRLERAKKDLLKLYDQMELEMKTHEGKMKEYHRIGTSLQQEIERDEKILKP